MLAYLVNIILPYIFYIFNLFGLSTDQPTLFLFDVFKAQLNTTFLQAFCLYNIFYILISNGCIDLLQLMDFSVNKYFKKQYKQQFITWLSHKIYKRVLAIEQRVNINFDLWMKIIKPLRARDMVSAHDDASVGLKEARKFFFKTYRNKRLFWGDL